MMFYKNPVPWCQTAIAHFSTKLKFDKNLPSGQQKINGLLKKGVSKQQNISGITHKSLQGNMIFDKNPDPLCCPAIDHFCTIWKKFTWPPPS